MPGSYAAAVGAKGAPNGVDVTYNRSPSTRSIAERTGSDAADPYYLHPSDGPNQMLVSIPLTGLNYHTWARAMRMALITKNKWRFVNGSITAPAENTEEYHTWERCNTLVLSWLLKAVSPAIGQSILGLHTAAEIWTDLKARYSKVDACRFADLQEQISTMKQGIVNESDRQTFESNYNRCSQPRKISIGVVVDSVAKLKSKNLDADKVAVPVSGDTNYGKGNSTEKVANLAKGNQGEPSSHDKSPGISTKSIHLNSTSKPVHPVEQTSNLHAINEMCNTSAGTKITPGTSSVHFSDYQNLKFLSNKAKERGGNDSAGEIAGKMSFKVAKEDMPVKASAADKSDRADTTGSESLRMQLKKILETVSSPTELCSNSEVFDMGAKGSGAEKKVTENHILKASSDTIENDTQSHEPTVRRPVTRSLNRKRAPPKSKWKNPKKKVPPCAQEERLETFYSGEEQGKRLCGAATGGSVMTHERLTKRKKSEIETHEISIGMDADKKQEQNMKCNKVPHAERSTDTTQSYEKSKSVSVEPRVDTSEKEFYKSPVVEETEQLRDINGVKLQENLNHSEDFGLSSLKKRFDSKSDVQRPTFETKTPLERSFIGSLPRSKRDEVDEHSDTEIMFKTRIFQKFKSFQRSRQENKSNEQDVSSDDEAVLEYPPPLKPKSLFGEDNCGKLSQSSSDDRNSESSEDRVHVKGCRKSPSLSGEVGTAEERKFAFKPGKGLFDEKENEDSESDLRQSDPSEEDEFDRAVSLFALALQRVRLKMKSMADKRCAEILTSAAEGIQRKLHNAENQTQADLRMLTSRSKGNQKHLEAIFQEQQEQLNVMYERFKEEVNQHLQGCRSTLERLEEHESELKATVEKQKVSKRKLLLQLEEEIQTQLVDAHTRISAVRHLARDKMHQLKLVVAECFKLS